MTPSLLPPQFYQSSTGVVARRLLGKLIRLQRGSKTFVARITETEAYMGVKDPTCHSYGGRRTERVQSMYLEGGHCYVYFIYGMYYCMNVVTRGIDRPEAVLIRAAHSVAGFSNLDDPRLLSGPGKLCREFGIDFDFDGAALFSAKSPLQILDDGIRVPRSRIVTARRVGIRADKEGSLWPLRFFIKSDRSVSVIKVDKT